MKNSKVMLGNENNFISKPELLSPAGSFEAFMAAINAGCDAVYLGGKKFGARAYANNFTNDEIKKALEIAHLNDVKVYYTANTIFKEKEIKDLLKQIEFLYEQGIDAIIIQDIGIYNIIKQNGLDLPLHGSTQMTVHSLSGTKYMEELGFERIVLSRELSLKEISNIKNKANIEVECFVHGALCYSYSGQCLLSSIIGGRSGNRGRCAQPCRLPYNIYRDNNILNKKKNSFLLSPKDIQTIHIIPELIKSGINSFKIEGRMKSPEYVGLITNIYRKYIDLFIDSPSDFTINDDDISNMLKIYNRGGFSKGYYYSKNGSNMMSTNKPNHAGIMIGRVEKILNNNIVLSIEDKIYQGDCIEIDSNNGDNYSFIAENNSDNKKMNVIINKRNNISNIKSNDLVYKLKDVKLIKSIKESIISNERKILVDGVFNGKVNENCSLTLIYKNIEVTEFGNKIEEAKTNPIKEDKVIKQVRKTGNYPITFNKLDVNIDDNIFMPISTINNLRRNAIEKLVNKLGSSYKRSKVDIKYENKKVNTNLDNNKLNVLIRKMYHFETVKNYNIDTICIELLQFTLSEIYYIIDYYKKVSTKVYIAMPKIVRDDKLNIVEKYINKLRNTNLDGFLIRSIDQYKLLCNMGKEICLDYSFNIFNNSAINFWDKDNINSIALSSELNNKEINMLNNKKSECLVYGYLPLMTSTQCIYKNTTSKCYNDKKYHELMLEDRKKIKFVVNTNCKLCQNTIYNSQPLILMDKYRELNCSGVSKFRVEFLNETSEDIGIIMDNAMKMKSYKDILIDDIINKIETKYFTRGHYTRGIM
jgi:putative protease